MESHGTGIMHAYDRVKQAVHMETDRADSLRQAILACRKGGTVSVLGIYGVTNKFPLGMIIDKGLALRSAQQHGWKYVRRLFDHILAGELDPRFMATHHMSLEDGAKGRDMFKNKTDGCVRVVFAPN